MSSIAKRKESIIMKSSLKPAEYALAIILVIGAFLAVPWSFNNWQKHVQPYSVLGLSPIGEAKINKVLCDAHSPACGTGHTLYNMGFAEGIDSEFALSIFHEGSNFGKLSCSPTAACITYDGKSWTTSYKAWFDTINGPEYVGAGLTTIPQIIAKMSPPDETAYAADVNASMTAWRTS